MPIILAWIGAVTTLDKLIKDENKFLRNGGRSRNFSGVETEMMNVSHDHNSHDLFSLVEDDEDDDEITSSDAKTSLLSTSQRQQ